MNLPCSFCPYGTPKTDRLKLLTIDGRDYLLCQEHFKQGDPNVYESNVQRNIYGVSKSGRVNG